MFNEARKTELKFYWQILLLFTDESRIVWALILEFFFFFFDLDRGRNAQPAFPCPWNIQFPRFKDLRVNHRTKLHIVQGGNITGWRYVEEVLKPKVRLIKFDFGPDILLLDDNSRSLPAYVIS